MRKEIERLIELDREQVLLGHIEALLGWDQATYMPSKAIEERADQIALVEGLAHERQISPEIGSILAALGSTADNPMGDPALSDPERAYLRVWRRQYDRETKLPAALVSEYARETSKSLAAWAKAREQNDFAGFAPCIEKMFRLSKERAACLNPEGRPYDVLLDLYEPGASEASVGAIFSALRTELSSLLGKIRSRPQVDSSFVSRPCDDAHQAAISSWLMNELNYDKGCGRLDTVEHPFTTTIGEHDVRITTRYLRSDFTSSMFSTIHESGHALYELGIAVPEAFRRTRLADAASMAVHESQSRLWENMVGRSESFWRPRYAKLQELAGGALDGVNREHFVRGINRVEPSLIRTEADEVTYCLHIILRFELESDLLAGRLAVKDLPEAWNNKMKELLGIVPPDNKSGCLQDMHWAEGYIGYFPSYALGNIYAAQFWDKMHNEHPDMEERLAAGDCRCVLDWLRKNVHSGGAAWLPSEIIRNSTDEPLNPAHYINYLNRKYAKVYGF